MRNLVIHVLVAGVAFFAGTVFALYKSHRTADAAQAGCCCGAGCYCCPCCPGGHERSDGKCCEKPGE